MASELTEKSILEVLKKVPFPGYSRDIVSFGLVKKVTVCEGNVKVFIKLISSDPNVPKKIEIEVKEALNQIPGVTQANVAIETTPAKATPTPGQPGQKLLTEVKNVIAVASGKGGVGKSTVAVNLALALKAQGLSVGLMDADVYGPSIPMMLGCHDRPLVEGEKIRPLERYGLKIMSIGFLVDENAPAIWRGPIVSRVVTQFLRDVKWGALDYLVIDLPPGTGDIQLTTVQSVPLKGAVIVTTPQDVALLDVIKANEMFKTVNTPILGVVENMSTYICSKCSHEEAIFGKGGGQKEADRIQVPFLGGIPLDPAICQGGDSGIPIFIQDSPSPVKEAFQKIAQKVVSSLQKPAVAQS